MLERAAMLRAADESRLPLALPPVWLGVDDGGMPIEA